MKPSHSPQHRFDEIDGVVVHSVSRGEGPDVLLLPSLVISSVTYRSTLQSLARHFKTTILDLPGAGMSQNPRRSMTTTDYAEFVVNFMEQRGIAKAIVVGHSNSGPIAMALARHHQKRVSHLVICNAIGVDCTRSVGLALLARAIDSAVIEPGFALLGHPDLLWNAFMHPQTFRYQAEQFKSCDILSDAAKVHVPTLVAWGRRDQTTPVSGAAKLAAELNNAQMYISKRGSHGWLVEYPDEFTEAVTRFYSRDKETSTVRRATASS